MRVCLNTSSNITKGPKAVEDAKKILRVRKNKKGYSNLFRSCCFWKQLVLWMMWTYLTPTLWTRRRMKKFWILFTAFFCTLMGGLGFQVQRRPFLYLETCTSTYFACKLQFFIRKLASSKKHLEPHLELLKPFLKCSFFPPVLPLLSLSATNYLESRFKSLVVAFEITSTSFF